MKKNIGIMVLLVLLTSVSLVFAQQMKGEMTDKGMKDNMMSGDTKGSMGQGMMDKGMMGDGMMNGKMKGMCSMMGSMMQTNMVASNDGGVIVLSGNKLTKYDNNLNVVKEVEIKLNAEAMQSMMKDMMDKCPMMNMMQGNMMGQGMMRNTTETQDQTTKK